MSEVFAAVAGHRVKALRLYVPNTGPWFADCDLDETATLAGKVSITVGAATLAGTVAPGSTGTFVLTTRVRVVGGGNGWGDDLPAKSYHNDSGVKSKTVAEDAAREAGETLGTFSPVGRGLLGNDYVRRAGPASRALEDTATGVPWWIDYDGRTNVAARPSTPLAADKFELMTFDPSSRMALVAVDDPSKLAIGSVLTDKDRLSAPITVRELQFLMTEGSFRAHAWCGGDDLTESKLVRQLSTIVGRVLARRLFGKYRYRVVSMASDGRANLQAVSKAVGLPDILPVTSRPGVAGVWADLALGCEVLVEFIAGAPSDPIVTAYPGRGEPGFVPHKLTLGAESPSGAAPAARQGDTVKVLLPPAIFSGTIVVSGTPSPATGVVSWVNPYGLGTIETGSAHVGIGP